MLNAFLTWQLFEIMVNPLTITPSSVEGYLHLSNRWLCHRVQKPGSEDSEDPSMHTDRASSVSPRLLSLSPDLGVNLDIGFSFFLLLQKQDGHASANSR